jgi:nodulation protein F
MNDEANKQFSDDILKMIASHAELKEGELSRATALDELGIHSLELTEIIMDIEEKYDIEIDLNTVDAWDTMKTVGDIIDAVQKLIAEKA